MLKKGLSSISQCITSHTFRRILGYVGLAVLFFSLSFATVYVVHLHFSEGPLRIPPDLLSVRVIGALAVLLVLYFMADGLRLYCIIRSMGFCITFSYIVKLVFINIFISNITPLSTGGGVIQVYFMNRKGMPIGAATAATAIRTLLAALMLFTLTPLIILTEPNQFRTLPYKHLLYGITGFSCVFLLFFLILLFRIKMIKRLLLRGLYLLHILNIISRSRVRSLFLKGSHEFDLFSDGFKRYAKGGRGWVSLSVVFTALFLLLLCSFSVVLIRALGYQVPVLTVMAFQVVITFFMYFAPTPGATGVAEGGYGLLLSQLVQGQDITILTLSWRFLTIYVGLLIGFFVLYKELFNYKRGLPDHDEP